MVSLEYLMQLLWRILKKLQVKFQIIVKILNKLVRQVTSLYVEGNGGQYEPKPFLQCDCGRILALGLRPESP